MKGVVSIIVPIYNTEAYLGRCIESILGQSYSNFELLLIDDGSTDNSLPVCKKYDDHRIRIYSKSNSGPGETRNYGLGVMSKESEYVCFCDSDDTLEPDYLLKFITSIGDCDLAICNVMNRYGDKTYWRKNIGGKDEVVWENPKINVEFLSLLKFGIMNSGCNKLYRKEIITKNNIIFNKQLRNEDACFNFEYLNYCKSIRYIDLPLYNYWHRSSSLTKTFNANLIHDYLDFHSNLLISFEPQFHKFIHQFLYPQYFGIQRNLVLSGKFDRAKYNRNQKLLRESIRSYKSSCLGEWLHHMVLWYLPYFYPLLLKLLK